MTEPMKFKLEFDASAGTLTLDGVVHKIEGIGKATKTLSDVLKSNFKKMFSSFSEISFGLNNTLQVAQKVISVVSEPLKKAMMFESISTKMEVVLGSTQKAKERLAELSEFTKTTSFGLSGIATLSNELQSVGQYSKETIKTLTDIASGSGKSLEQVTEAYIKMARGKKGAAVELFRDIGVTMEDFVKATGKNVDQQTGMIKASTQEMMQSLNQIVADKGFDKMAEKQANTLEGQLNRFNASISSMVGEIGKELLPLAKSILDAILPIMSVLKEIVKFIASGMGTIIENLKGIITIVGLVAVSFAAWKASVMLTTSALWTGLLPAINAQVVATGSLKSAIEQLIITKSKAWVSTIKTLATTMGSTLLTALTKIKTAVQALWGAISANPLGAVVAAIGLVIAALAAYNAFLKETTKKQIENKEAELGLIESQKERIKTTISEKENVKGLLNEYEALVNTTNRTAEQENRLTEVSKKLDKEYPGIIRHSGDFSSTLEDVRKKAYETAGEIGGLVVELKNLELQSLQTQKDMAGLNVEVAKEDLIRTYADETGNFLDSIHEFVFSTSAAMESGKKGFESFFDTISNTTDIKEIGKAYDAIVKQINSTTDVSATTKKKIIEDIAKVRETRITEVNELERIAEKTKKVQESAFELQGVDVVAEMTDKVRFEKLEKSINDLNQEYTDFVDNAKKTAQKVGEPLENFLQGETFDNLKKRFKDLLLDYPLELTNQQVTGFKSKFSKLFPEDKKKTNNDKDNTFEFYKLLYETEKIAAEDYKNKINELIKKITDNKEYKRLSKISHDKLTQAERAKKIAFDNELRGYSKTLEDVDKQEEERQAKKFITNLNAMDKRTQEIERRYKQGLMSTQEYYNKLQTLYAEMDNSTLSDLYKKWVEDASQLTDEESKAIDTYIKQHEDLFNKMSDVNSKAENIKMADFEKILSIKQDAFSSGTLQLEEYRQFLSNKLDEFQNMFDEKMNHEKFGEQYSNIFKGLMKDNWTDAWLDAEIERLRIAGDEQADALKGIIANWQKYKEEDAKVKNELTEQQQFFGDVMTTSMDALTKGLGEALASGFGKEGFKKLSQNLFEGFKSILTQTLDFIEKEYLLAGAKSLVDAVLNPGKAALDGVALIGAEVALQTAKAAINAWTPKFALGGGVTGPTYLMAGENNKKEYIISPDQMKNEVRSLLKTEFKYYYHPQQTKQVVEVRMQPVEMIQKGRDLHGIIRQQEILENSFTF